MASSGAIVGFAKGYVAVAERMGATAPTVLFSSDGRSWRFVELPAPEPIDPPSEPGRPAYWARPAAVATDGHAVVAVGAYYHEPCDWPSDDMSGGGPACPSSPMSWTTSDGLSWQAGPLGQGPKGDRQGTAFTSVWAVPGAWEAGVFFVGGEAGQQREVWRSTDGRTWAKGGDLVTTDAPLRVGVGIDALRVAASPCDAGATCRGDHLWVSRDGRAWSDEALAEPRSAGYITDVLGPVDAGDFWIVAGAARDTSGTAVPSVWTSADLRDWTARPLPGIAHVDGRNEGVIRVDGRYVAIASGWGGPDAGHGTWTSRDGASWTLVSDPPDIQALADGPRGVIGLGVADDAGSMGIYELR